MNNASIPELPVQSFLQQLVGDVIAASNRLASNDTEGNRRDLVRTTFAAIEGSVWTMRESVRESAASAGNLSPAADMALREVTVHVDGSGNAIEQIRFLTLPTVIRLTIKQVQLIDDTFNPSLSDQGWDSLQQALKVRHRITHPKTAPDLAITDEELIVVKSGLAWLLALVEQAILRTVAASKIHLKLQRELLDALKRGDPETLEIYYRELSKSDIDRKHRS